MPPGRDGAREDPFERSVHPAFPDAHGEGSSDAPPQLGPPRPAALLQLARGDSPLTPAITAAETKLLLSAIRGSNDPLRMRDEALFSTYALTGLRRAEALRLDASDYDAGKGVLRVKDGKGRRTRTVPVTQPLGLLLRRFRDDSAGRRSGGKLFPGSVPGKGLTPREAHARFQRWKSAAGLMPELTIHSFRAGFATALHRGCGDVILASRALGHRDLRPTLRYVEPHPRYLPGVRREKATTPFLSACTQPPPFKSLPRQVVE